MCQSCSGAGISPCFQGETAHSLKTKRLGKELGRDLGYNLILTEGIRQDLSKALTFEQRPETKPGVSQRKSMSGTEGIVTIKGPGMEMSTCPPIGKSL